MTRGVRPVERECSATLEEMREVVKSVSAAVPAPAHLCAISDPGRRWLYVPYVWSNVVDLFAVFVSDDGACGGSCVCAEDDAVLEFDAYDRCPC
jgi:hypothetical protein